MQQLHCNSPRAGLLLRASRPRTACSSLRRGPGQAGADWPSGGPLCAGCVEGLREGFGVKREGRRRGLDTCHIISDLP